MNILIFWAGGLVVLFLLVKLIDWTAGEFLTLAIIWTATVALLYFNEGIFNDERRAQIMAERAVDEKPYLTTQPMGNGCTINYWYGYGRKQSYTTKFVYCPNATTQTTETWPCGTPKAPKTCSREIETRKP